MSGEVVPRYRALTAMRFYAHLNIHEYHFPSTNEMKFNFSFSHFSKRGTKEQSSETHFASYCLKILFSSYFSSN